MQYSLFLSVLIPLTFAQYPPISNLTRITSPVDGNITISYKTPPTGTCQTVFDSQEQYTGWVNIPGSYATNTFFWFISARNPTDQLTIWLNGGPGSSSMIGLFNENGPCEVVEMAQGQFGTAARDWGWDRGSNMLYIDQVCNISFPSLYLNDSLVAHLSRISCAIKILGLDYRTKYVLQPASYGTLRAIHESSGYASLVCSKCAVSNPPS